MYGGGNHGGSVMNINEWGLIFNRININEGGLVCKRIRGLVTSLGCPAGGY